MVDEGTGYEPGTIGGVMETRMPRTEGAAVTPRRDEDPAGASLIHGIKPAGCTNN
jgi:hypothetical protein